MVSYAEAALQPTCLAAVHRSSNDAWKRSHNYHEWHRDDLQEFRHNRYAISETLEDAAGKPPLLPLLAVLRHL